MKQKGINRIRLTNKMVLIGIGLGTLFWVFESVMRVLVFHTGNLVSETFFPDPNQLWMRVLAAFILIAFGIYAQGIVTRRERAELVVRESQAWLSAAINSIGDAVMATDTNGAITFINPVAQSLTGWDQESAFGKPLKHVFNIINEETREPAESPVTKVIQKGRVVGPANHTILVAKDGKETAIDDGGAPIRNEEGETIGVILVFRDASKRKQAEDALHRSEERYRRITAAVTDYIFTVHIEDGQPAKTVYSPACVAITGYTSEDFASDPLLWFRMVHEEDREAVQEQARQVLLGQDVQPLEHRILRKDRVMRWVRKTLVPHYDSHGKPLSYDGLISDIHERRQTEEVLREREATLESIFRVAPTGIGMVTNRVFKQVNDRICEMTGYSREELLEQSARMLYPTDEDFDYVGQEKYAQIRERGIGTVTTRWKRKDGKVIDVLLSSTSLDSNDPTAGVTFTALDITERKKAEEELQESEDRYRRITEAITDYIYTVTIEGSRPLDTVHGPGCVAVTGYTAEDFKKNPYLWIQMVHEQERDAVEEQATRTLSGEKVPALEHRIIRKDGATRWVRNTPVLNFDSQGTLLSYDGLVQDVTERKEAEEALRKAHDELERFNVELEKKVQERTEELREKNRQLVEVERLAALGKMANRVAHELRNPLTAVGGFARRINEKTADDDPKKKYLQIIVEKVITMENKVSEITRIQSP